jgi:thioredoxin 1
MSNQIQAISDDSFENEVIASNVPVIVDFWAQWCAPCKALAPVLEDVATKFNGQVKFVKLDVDSNPSTPPKFGVRGIPTLILFKDGQVKATQVGLIGKAELTQFIEGHLA